MTAIEMIHREREHQIARGWCSLHDDTHDAGELGEFARMLLHATLEGWDEWDAEPDEYDAAAWIFSAVDHALTKHPDPVDRLRIVGALIVAEIERRMRVTPTLSTEG